MTDQQRLRELVLGSVQRAANHPSVGTAQNLQARAEDIDPMRYFTTQDFNGRVLPQQKWTQPKPLPTVGVFGKPFQR
jgi:hypothetical protein